MEHTVLFEEQVALTPDDVSKAIRSIDEILLNKVKLKLGKTDDSLSLIYVCFSNHILQLHNSINVLAFIIYL